MLPHPFAVNDHDRHHDHGHHHDHSAIHERKTRIVVLLTAVTMVVEIGFGYLTNSMALLADGWHMSSHVFAIGLTWIAYVVSRKHAQTARYSFKKEKLLALSGFTSALVLQVVAVMMAVQSFDRLLHPLAIKFSQAIIVAVIGLAVNGICALTLKHEHEHSEPNIKSAYLHVLADGLTSVAAIIALLGGMLFNIYSLDAISGVISSVIITKWAVGLLKDSGAVLLDFKRS